MIIRISFFTSLLFQLFLGQALSQEKKKVISQIYRAVIIGYYNNRAASIVINDSTVNSYIGKTNSSEIADAYAGEIPPIYIDTRKMDSSWAITLSKVDIQKGKLFGYRIPIFKTDSIHIQFIKRDENPKYAVGDRISLSSVILIGRRAIVETEHYCGDLCGHGSIYFLEKKRGKWVIVSILPTWIS